MTAHLNRPIAVFAAVLGLHLAVVWALHNGLRRTEIERLVTVQVLAELLTPPPAAAAPPAPPPAPAPVMAKPPPPPRPVPPPPATPAAPVANVPPVQPSSLAETPMPPVPAVSIPSPLPAPPLTSAPAPAPAPATPIPVPVELPSSSAAYLNNPLPPYPSLSRRLGEQGTVVVRVLIGVDGRAAQASIERSSGFERLDRTALQTALGWRYVPGKRGGQPEAMWFNVPIVFSLTDKPL